SGMFNSGSALFGPLVSSRIKNGHLSRATLLGIFAISNFMRFPFMVFTGLLTREIFKNTLLLLPVFVVAIVCGHAVYKYISERLLRNLMLVFFTISGIFLLAK